MWAVLRAPEVNNFKEYFVVVGYDKMISLIQEGGKGKNLDVALVAFASFS